MASIFFSLDLNLITSVTVCLKGYEDAGCVCVQNA